MQQRVDRQALSALEAQEQQAPQAQRPGQERLRAQEAQPVHEERASEERDGLQQEQRETEGVHGEHLHADQQRETLKKKPIIRRKKKKKPVRKKQRWFLIQRALERKVELALGRSGVPLGKLISGAIHSFHIDRQGFFVAELWRNVRMRGSHGTLEAATTLRGRVGPEGIDRLEGLSVTPLGGRFGQQPQAVRGADQAQGKAGAQVEEASQTKAEEGGVQAQSAQPEQAQGERAGASGGQAQGGRAGAQREAAAQAMLARQRPGRIPQRPRQPARKRIDERAQRRYAEPSMVASPATLPVNAGVARAGLSAAARASLGLGSRPQRADQVLGARVPVAGSVAQPQRIAVTRLVASQGGAYAHTNDPQLSHMPFERWPEDRDDTWSSEEDA